MLHCSIDLDADGLQIGYLKLIHSDDRYSCSTIPVPIISMKNGSGPTVLLTAGVHGDEYAGIAALRRFVACQDVKKINGHMIILPTTNYPAFCAVSRVSPLDQMNLNRIFPGAPDGSPTEQIANYIDNQLLPKVDFALDFHTGASQSDWLPCTFIYGIKNNLMQAKVDAVNCFGTEYSMVIPGGGSSGSLLSACERHNIPSISTEIRGGATLHASAYHIALSGLYRTLKLWGVLDAIPVEEHTTNTSFMQFQKIESLMAPIDGMIVPEYNLGADVKAGELAARIYPIDDLSRAPIDIKYDCDGVVSMCSTSTLKKRGDYICNVAQEIDISKYL